MPAKSKPAGAASHSPSELRIVGGDLGGRKIAYHGGPTTRPMKHRVREALFNLVGPAVKGTHAVDLFAGTGAVGLEAISRGAAAATFIERHYPTAKTLQANIASLGVQDRSQVVTSDTFFWSRDLPDCLQAAKGQQWSVYCCPPYALYVDKTDEICELVASLIKFAPPGSTFVVEADERFDFGRLVEPEQWDVRTYSPAVLGMFRVK